MIYIIHIEKVSIQFLLGITQQLAPELIGDFYRNTGLNAPGGILRGGMRSLEKHSLMKLLGDFGDPILYEKLNGKMFIGMIHTFFRYYSLLMKLYISTFFKKGVLHFLQNIFGLANGKIMKIYTAA